MNTVLFFSRDPGGTNQLIALHALIDAAQIAPPSLRDFIADLFDDTANVVVSGKDTAVDFWRKAGVEAQDWSAFSADECVARLYELAPNHLITATTDIDDRTDLKLWQAARARGISSTAFTDHKINLVRRFMDQEQLLVQPDCVFAIDEDCRDILIAGGLAHGSVQVGGDLHIGLLKQRVKQDAPGRQALRTLWRVKADETVVLFVSENSREMSAAGRLGNYDEFECLDYVIGELSKPGTDLNGRAPFALSNATVVIRPHPKDTPGKYAAYAQTKNPRVIISSDGDGTTVVAASDLVVGMQSSLFAEAEVLNVPIVSLIDGDGVH